MASPVAVITNPLDDDLHILFTLNDKKQLAMELRKSSDTETYEPYQDNGTIEGSIINPAQISVVILSGMPTVYGIATSNPKKDATVSMLSPIYNPVPDKKAGNKLLPTSLKALAACGNEKNEVWLYYTRMNEAQTAVELVAINPKNGGASPVDLKIPPGSNSNLAAFFNQHRFVFFTNTDDDNYVYYYNSGNGNMDSLAGDVKPASPLAVTQVASQNRDGQYHIIVLYYMTSNKGLGRVVGDLLNGTMNWSQPTTIKDAPKLDQTTMLTVTTSITGVNYVYYIPKGGKQYKPWVDSNDNWRGDSDD
ncbi:hypothetical protein F4678DRAFT_443088 [Xylaria arbuscula]|nr:hypothetical protein F4678DRAFT_443088 [Xylaria arbuscula]